MDITYWALGLLFVWTNHLIASGYNMITSAS